MAASSLPMLAMDAPAALDSPVCVAWRHPKPHGASGRCIGGGTDLPVDRRKAKRLAHRIRKQARRHGWPRIIHTSPLRRCALVGRILKSWGWRHHLHASLLEMRFGRWDGQPWSEIPHAEVDAWCADFRDHKPGGVEALSDVFVRVEAWWSDRQAEPSCLLAHPEHMSPHAKPQAQPFKLPLLIVGHGGWMLAARWLQAHPDAHHQEEIRADEWPAPPAYGQCWRLLPPASLTAHP